MPAYRDGRVVPHRLRIVPGLAWAHSVSRTTSGGTGRSCFPFPLNRAIIAARGVGQA
jgi:hypothetical protein